LLTARATEEEKKVVAPLLGKLYISPASSEDKIRDLYEDVSAAVDSRLLSDAAGRNALYKIHVSLGKIVNSLAEQQEAAVASRRVSMSRSVSVASTAFGEDKAGDDDRTVLAEPEIKEEEELGDSGEGTVIQMREGEEEQDSLVDDLLTDGEA
jgi:condensin complex subunit 3